MTNIIKHSYNGAIVSQEPDGYVSLTDMAKASDKQVAKYLENQSTKLFLEGLSQDLRIPLSSLIRVVKGKGKQQGTWAHPEVAIDFAQWCSVPFRIWANRTLRGVISQPAPEPKRAVSYYTDRIVDLPKRLICPSGYWAVIEECGHLLLDVERAGYPIDRFDILDGSVGRRYSDFRKNNNISNPTAIATYKVDACPKPVPIAVYPYSEMGIFKRWLKEVYMVNHLPKYLQDKYGKLAKV